MLPDRRGLRMVQIVYSRTANSSRQAGSERNPSNQRGKGGRRQILPRFPQGDAALLFGSGDPSGSVPHTQILNVFRLGHAQRLQILRWELAVTNTNGVYRFIGLAPGNYTVSTRARRCNSSTAQAPAGAQGKSSPPASRNQTVSAERGNGCGRKHGSVNRDLCR